MANFNQKNFVITAAQMQSIETEIFNQGMPVPALMEKAAGLIAQHIQHYYPLDQYPRMSILVGCGHNGGDALVVARELCLQGYQIKLLKPLLKLKPLTQNHWDYAMFLGLSEVENITDFIETDLIIDGLFGFGLERLISGNLADIIEALNKSQKPIVSIDIPSGMHTNTGEMLGTAIQATESLCLGLWKQAYIQDQSIPYLGKITCLDFGIPPQILTNQFSSQATIQLITDDIAKQYLPLRRSPLTHKYQQGHLLLIGGSEKYAGSVLLAGLGARATGVGMLTIVVPESLKMMVVSQLPEALVIGCPETETGAIQALPDLDLEKYQAIACGCGLTLAGAANILPTLLETNNPLILDADALNWVAQEHLQPLQKRPGKTILTPHLGEFKRLFPGIENTGDRLTMNQQAAAQSGAIILFKGAKTLITQPDGKTYAVMDSTPALARGGSGDVLLGTIGGLLTQQPENPFEITATAAWWHAKAGILAAKNNTILGVEGQTLTIHLSRFLTNIFI